MEYDEKYEVWSEGHDEGYAQGVVDHAEGRASLVNAKLYLRALKRGYHSGYNECLHDHHEEYINADIIELITTVVPEGDHRDEILTALEAAYGEGLR